ncbi:MAG: penicillin-binding protein activator LpoB [Spirochaetaceae bacterium]
MKIKIILVIFTILASFGCQTANNRVTRVSSDLETDLSGRWNDTDSRLVSEEMTLDLLNRTIFYDFKDEFGKKPVLIIGRIKNNSSEHISVQTFIKDIERELINSGQVKLVASSSERDGIRDEKEDQQSNSSLETAKRLAQETGADIMLIGSIATINDQLNNSKVVYYQVDLELIHLESNEKMWIGTKKHKKIIELGGVKW